MATGEAQVALSAISVVELTHGICRAKSEKDRMRRRLSASDVFGGIVVHPVTLEIAELDGRLEGEQAALGVTIAFQDLLIAATALQIGFGVATINIKHFACIPGLALASF